jgi:hypothetical protein
LRRVRGCVYAPRNASRDARCCRRVRVSRNVCSVCMVATLPYLRASAVMAKSATYQHRGAFSLAAAYLRRARARFIAARTACLASRGALRANRKARCTSPRAQSARRDAAATLAH